MSVAWAVMANLTASTGDGSKKVANSSPTVNASKARNICAQGCRTADDRTSRLAREIGLGKATQTMPWPMDGLVASGKVVSFLPTPPATSVRLRMPLLKNLAGVREAIGGSTC
eukprot:scaffold228442_cov36-Prasinocladus_malaysianus.AAC.1